MTRMATCIWLLLLLALLYETTDANITNHASLNRNHAEDNKEDNSETAFTSSSPSSLFPFDHENKTDHINENLVVADNDDDDSLFDKRANKEANPMLDRPHSDVAIDVDALGTYLKSCRNCLESSTDCRCPMKTQAMDMKKWMVDLQKVLSFGCQLGGQCGGSDMNCCYNQDAILEGAIRDMTDKARQLYTVLLDACVNCPRDGQWSDWCQWNACSETCGFGTRTRTRRCNNPTPKGTGLPCPGEAVQMDSCGGQSCCVDGNWGPWDSWDQCSPLACNQVGTRERRRLCDSPPPDRCGRVCQGDRLQRDACVGPCLPQWGEWGEWCACDCRGKRYRRRPCRMSGGGAELDAIRCGPDARMTETCDARYNCPACLRDGDCAGKKDGQYPSCTGCQHYVICSRGQTQVLDCSPGMEWDQDQSQCVPGLSRSCALVDCVYDCTERGPGLHPSCDGCEFYEECPPESPAGVFPTRGLPVKKQCPMGQEFNAHLRHCVQGRSPTCVVPRALPLPNDEGREDVMAHDAPAASDPVANNLPKPQHQELDTGLAARMAIAAKFNRIHDDGDDDLSTMKEEKEAGEVEMEKGEEGKGGEAEEEDEIGRPTLIVRVTKPVLDTEHDHHLPDGEEDNEPPQ